METPGRQSLDHACFWCDLLVRFELGDETTRTKKLIARAIMERREMIGSSHFGMVAVLIDNAILYCHVLGDIAIDRFDSIVDAKQRFDEHAIEIRKYATLEDLIDAVHFGS